ncbi:DMT family transporter [Cognatishimia sp.]|uniref:DMT family transporter n=1 Tax=Cognatishimia sp. TaxID=2211648 RepID=UPI0035162C76
MTIQNLLYVAGLVFVSVSLIVLGDTFGKLLTSEGFAPATIAFSRFFIGALVILAFSGLKLHELRIFTDWRILLRATLVTGAILCILTALKTEPIANVFGAFFIGPVVSYGLAVLFLKERPTAGRLLFLGLGFAGVMLVVKPGFGTSIGILFALLSGFFYGCFLAATRLVAQVARPRLLLLTQLAFGSVLLAPLGLSAPLPDITLPLSGWVLGSALCSAAGNYLLLIANRHAEASLIAPLIYTQLVSATIVGYFVFSDVPDSVSMIGLGMILLSGAGSLWIRWQDR